MRRIAAGLALVCIFCLLWLPACGWKDSTPVLRPIIIVDIDTLRADHLGLYGYPRPTSPNLDAFAQEAIVFDWAFSQAPNTAPSQTSIMTGLYPSTHGMITDGDRVPDHAVTLAEALAAVGYKTAGFHDGAYMRNAFNIGQGFALYNNSRRKGLAAIGPKATRWLHEHHLETFLLLIHTYDVHAPYAPPAPFDSAFTAGLEAPSPGFSPTAERMNEIRLSRYTDSPVELAPNDLEYAKALYDGGILFVDDWFGSFMETIRELGLDERAIIVVISDHGEEFLEHASVLHEKLYATVTRVPLMIRLPDGARAGRIDRVVETIDLMPTLLSLVGVKIPDAVQGRSLLSLIDGSADREPHFAFGETPFYGESRFIATDDVRVQISMQGRQTELYRYRDDPLEQIDRSSAETEKMEGLLRALEGWQAMAAAATLESGTESDEAELDPETLDDLKALGYIQ